MKIFCAIVFIFLYSSNVFCQKNKIDFYVNQALANSPLLKDYKNQVAAGYYDSLLILADYKPQLTGNGNNSYAPVVRGWGYDNAVTNGANISATVGVNKQLMNKKAVAALFQNIQLQNQTINNTSKMTEQDL